MAETPSAEDPATIYWTKEELDYWEEITSSSLWMTRKPFYGRRKMKKKFGHSPDDCWKIHDHTGKLVTE